MDSGRENLRVQKWVIAFAVILFSVKLVAYLYTGSVAILTDALESTVNIAAGLIGFFSIYIAAKPKDENHPYGHGKAEFLSAAVEGTLIAVAGAIVIYKAVFTLINPVPVQKLDFGILLISITAVANYVLGFIAVRYGKKNNSLALIASGMHLKSDTWTTIGIIVGLVLIYLTGLVWLDSAVAILFAFILIYTGYKIIRRSIAGIMDEADLILLNSVVEVLNGNRRNNWVDLHNLRAIKYGGRLHIDCHLTVPWYFNVNEAHAEIDELTSLIRKQLGNSVEFFVHSDGCLYYQCNICNKENCPVRQHVFQEKVEWTLENLLSDRKHRLPDEKNQG